MAQRLKFRNTHIQLGTVARSVTRLLGEFRVCYFVAWPKRQGGKQSQLCDVKFILTFREPCIMIYS
jgi:hypothetical protein